MNEHETKTEEVLDGTPAPDKSPPDTAASGAAVGKDSGADAEHAADGQVSPGEAAETDVPVSDAETEDSGGSAGRVAALEKQVADREEALLRMQAELENLRKRAARDVESARKFALERFVSELLPVKDSMELGIAACANEGADLESVREGVELTHKMLVAAVEKFGVVEVSPQGEAFDPEFHQAMSMQESDGVEPGRVVMVVQKGYTLNDRLVRPAMVIVSK